MSYDNYSTSGAICPHCDHCNKPDDDNYRLYDKGTDEWWCGSCEKTFRVAVYLKYSWTTEALE